MKWALAAANRLKAFSSQIHMKHKIVNGKVGLAALMLLLFAPGCEEKNPEVEVEEACKAGLGRLGCDGDLFDEDNDEEIKGCVEDAEDARAISEECGDSHLELLNCLGGLACTNIGTWRSDKCGEVTPDYCGPEATAFCELCPGIWYVEE